MRSKMPKKATLSIQYDKATPHTAASRQVLDAAMQGSPGKHLIRLVGQEAQSPDTNALDLGFKNSLDSRLPRMLKRQPMRG